MHQTGQCFAVIVVLRKLKLVSKVPPQFIVLSSGVCVRAHVHVCVRAHVHVCICAYAWVRGCHESVYELSVRWWGGRLPRHS